MFERKKIAADFSAASCSYANFAALQLAVGSELVEKSQGLIADDSLLLDIGAGEGMVTQLWKRKIIAADIAFGMCALARKRQIDSVNAAAEHLPFKADCFDAVVSNLMLQWIAEPECFFTESFNVLKPGGILAFSTFTEGTLDELQQAFSACGQQKRINDFITATEILRYAENCNFRLIARECKIITEIYNDVSELFANIKAIGAANKRLDRPRGMMTPRLIKNINQQYNKNNDGKITASWIVEMIWLRK